MICNNCNSNVSVTARNNPVNGGSKNGTKGENVSPFSNERRNAYVVEHLTSSMLELLKEKPLNEISISELCGMAGVGRTSFYRNYEEKEDIIKAYVEHLFQDWVGRWKETPDLPVKETVRIVFSHFEANREFYTLLNERGLVYLLKDIILDLCGFNPEQEMRAAYSSAYVAFFLYGWIDVWFRRGMKDTTEELIAYLPQ